ncbi:MAG: aminopeptidase P family protein [Bacteroidota bacterium]
MNVGERLAALRAIMKSRHISAYLIPNADPHLSEYLADYWRIMPWLTGFTGSAGHVVVTQDFAGVWTDSRYFLQAEQELAGSEVQLMKLRVPHTPEFIAWLGDHVEAGQKVGVDARLLSASRAKQLEGALAKKEIKFADVGDLSEKIWQDRPEISERSIFLHQDQFAGQSREEKFEAIRASMQEAGVTHHFLSSLDEIAWILNFRGSDVDFNPVAIAFLMIGLKEASLFIDAAKVPDEVAKALGSCVSLHPYENALPQLKKLRANHSLYLDPARTNYLMYQKIPAKVKKVEGLNLSIPLKARKNPIEMDHIRATMVKDGVAMVRFLYWLQQEVPKGKLTEYTIGEKLETFRHEEEHFVGPSFGTIAGYQGNGAIVHYSAQEETAAQLLPEGILLLDSGGQYLDGTTDITRTVALGTPTADQKRDFTLVLKGHIALASAIFPTGTKGYQLEGLARRYLWKYGLNYGHGTGHGVGFFLNVHEGPQTFGSGATASKHTAFEVGMLTSNEPGVYHQGKYGIRIENLVLCVPHDNTEFGHFLTFETVTLCPIDHSLIDKSMLSPDEIQWVNSYHQKVYQKLAPKLPPTERSWLAEQTGAL